MTDGSFISAAAVFAILAAVAVLASLSSLVLLWVGDLPERHAVAIFWGCLVWTWLLAVVAAAAIQGST